MSAHLAEQNKPLLVEDGRQTPESFEYLTPHVVTDRRRRIVMKLLALAHPAHLTTMGKRFGYALVPSPIRSWVWDDHAPTPKQFPTSYLNGLRGLTAVKVFTFHYFMAFTDFTYDPYKMDERHDNIMILPILRYFWTGFTSQMFFAIAGYLTCLRLFQLLDKNDANTQAKIFSTIVASLFRRGFRLYLPVALIMFIMSTYIYLGLYETNRPFLRNGELFQGPWMEPKPEMYPTFREQMKFWRTEMYFITDVSSTTTVYPLNDQHLWSILAEMRASLHLYLCLIMLAGCKRYVRLAGLCVMTWLFYIWNRWETWVYILGAIVAQIDIILADRRKETEQVNLPVIETEKVDEKHAELGFLPGRFSGMTVAVQTVENTKRHLRSGVGILCRYFFFLLSFYLMSYPIDGPIHFSPGYETLKSLIPEWIERKDKVYPNIGSGIILFLLTRSDPQQSKWRRILMSNVAQYLGTISFALYLVHGPLLHMFGYMIPQHIWWSFGVQGKDLGNTCWLVPILIGYSISLIVSWAAADVWTREVEARLVKFVKRLEGWCFKAKEA